MTLPNSRNTTFAPKSQLPAADMNDIQDLLVSLNKEKILKYDSIRATSSSTDTYDAVLRGLGRHPVTGVYCLSVRDPGVNSKMASIKEDGITIITNTTVGDDGLTDHVAFAPSKDIASSGPGLYASAGIAGGNFRIFYSLTGFSWTAVTTDFTPPTGTDPTPSMAYDSTAGVVVGGVNVAGQVPKLFRIVDSVTPTLTLPTTVPAFAASHSDVTARNIYTLASGGGVSLFVYALNTNAYSVSKSTDGGDVWTTVTAPTAPSGTGRLFGVYFVPATLSNVAKFIAITTDGTDLIVYSTIDNAATWQVEYTDTTSVHEASNEDIVFIDGNVVMWDKVASQNEVRVLNIATGKSYTFFVESGGNNLATDGTKLLIASISAGAGAPVYITTNPVATGLDVDGDPL